MKLLYIAGLLFLARWIFTILDNLIQDWRREHFSVDTPIADILHLFVGTLAVVCWFGFMGIALVGIVLGIIEVCKM
jgi:hypothetical protein